MRKDTCIDVECVIISERKGAYLIRANNNQAWLDRGSILSEAIISDDALEIVIPEKLAKEKGFI